VATGEHAGGRIRGGAGALLSLSLFVDSACWHHITNTRPPPPPPPIVQRQDRLENLRWELEILEQRHARVCAERDALYERFQAAMQCAAAPFDEGGGGADQCDCGARRDTMTLTPSSPTHTLHQPPCPPSLHTQDVKQKSGFRTLLLERAARGRSGGGARMRPPLDLVAPPPLAPLLALLRAQVERQSVALAEVSRMHSPRRLSRFTPSCARARRCSRRRAWTRACWGASSRRSQTSSRLRTPQLQSCAPELARLAAAHDRAVDHFTAKMREFGIPAEELGFAPATSAQLLAASHAGAVDAAQARQGRLLGQAGTAEAAAATVTRLLGGGAEGPGGRGAAGRRARPTCRGCPGGASDARRASGRRPRRRRARCSVRRVRRACKFLV